MELVAQCCELWADPPAWQHHLIIGLEALIGGSGGLLAVTRYANGAPVVEEILLSKTNDLDARSSFDRYLQNGAFQQLPGIDIIASTVLRVGHYAWRQSALMGSARAFRNSAFHDCYMRDLAVVDLLSSVAAAQDGRFLGLCFMRRRSDKAFLQRDQNLLDLVTSGVAPHVGKRLVLQSQYGQHRLTSRQQTTLSGLLAGHSEKQIALRLGISATTVHEYVGAIYAQHGVHSRSELMAYYLWRSRGDRSKD